MVVEFPENKRPIFKAYWHDAGMPLPPGLYSPLFRTSRQNGEYKENTANIVGHLHSGADSPGSYDWYDTNLSDWHFNSYWCVQATFESEFNALGEISP